jgi:hypothetical protein
VDPILAVFARRDVIKEFACKPATAGPPRPFNRVTSIIVRVFLSQRLPRYRGLTIGTFSHS